jgi:hypothetical protein
MRRSTLALAAILGFSCAAHAQCLDTLYLTDLTVLHMSVADSKNLGTWDSTSLNPWNDSDLVKADAVNLGSYEGVYQPHSRTATHPRTIFFSCGADSHSVVEEVAVTDSFYSNSRGMPTTTTSITTAMNSLALTLATNQGFVFNGVDESFAILYIDELNNSISVGRQALSDSLQSWSSSPLAFYFTTPSSGQSLVPNVLSTVGGYYPGALKNYALSTPDSALAALAPYVDEIASHQVDSTRMEVKVFHYTYSYSRPTSAIRNRSGFSQSFQARSTAQGVEIQIDHATQVQIVGLDGRLATSFAAHAGTNLWNGRSASGNQLTGLWIVRAEGVGAMPVVLR